MTATPLGKNREFRERNEFELRGSNAACLIWSFGSACSGVDNHCLSPKGPRAETNCARCRYPGRSLVAVAGLHLSLLIITVSARHPEGKWSVDCSKPSPNILVPS